MLNHWNYRIIKSEYKYPTGEIEYHLNIHEVYYDENKNITAYSEKPIAIGAETIEELKDDYEKYGRAFSKDILCKKELDDFFKEKREKRVEKYQYSVEWSKEDRGYIGLCSLFPSLSYLAKIKEDALEGIQELVADVDLDLNTKKE